MRPLERLLLSITPKAWETRPSAVAHSLVISPALATPLWGITLSSATTETIPSRTDLTTVHLERLRSLTIPLAITTASSVRLHFNSILPAKPIRPLVMVRSKEIPPATLIPRVVFEHSSATPLASKTRRQERSHLRTTLPAASTPPTGHLLSVTTPLASETLPTVSLRSVAMPPVTKHCKRSRSAL